MNYLRKKYEERINKFTHSVRISQARLREDKLGHRVTQGIITLTLAGVRS